MKLQEVSMARAQDQMPADLNMINEIERQKSQQKLKEEEWHRNEKQGENGKSDREK